MNIFHKLTLKILAKNKVRTLVTIIGIILSVSMFTAVTTLISSLRHYLIETVIAQDGDWHGAIFSIEADQLEELTEHPEVISLAAIKNIGYALLPESANEYKPYLFIGAIDDSFADIMPVNLTGGAMPQNSDEILLPKHLKTNGGISYKIGDILNLDIGERSFEGNELNQMNACITEEDRETGKPTIKEQLTIREHRSFTVVGFYERPSFENYSAAGYTALTGGGDGRADTAMCENSYDVYIKLASPREIYSFIEAKFPQNGSRINNDLLRFSGNSNEQTFNAVLFSMAGILIAIIMFGSISLIYNAFSISISERTKQYGLLSSVGATKKQITRSVLYEAAILSAAGIPIGILAGIAGIGVTFKLTEDLFSSFTSSGSDVFLTLYVSWSAVAAAAAIGLLTVLISAYIPAKRAVKVSAIDAIRQTEDIFIKAKEVKTSKLAYRLFGFEGMIAGKNFKRNKKRYRATVVSLFMSVVLFISASSFCAYISASSDSIIDETGFDIVYSFSPDEANDYSPQELFEELASVSGVTEAEYAYEDFQTVKIPTKLISKDYIEYCGRIYGEEFLNEQSEEFEFRVSVNFVDNVTYSQYLRNNSLDEEIYMNTASPKAVALDFVKIYNGEEGRYYTFDVLKAEAFDITLNRIKSEIDGYRLYNSETDDTGKVSYIFENQNGERIKLSEAEATDDIALQVGTVQNNSPFCIDRGFAGIILLYPYDAITSIYKVEKVQDAEMGAYLCFKADNHKAVFDKMSGILEEKGLPANLFDYADTAESTRALITVVNVFSYGFIILISLIAAANVFNTISTNIGLRRREFAILKSIGMTLKGFKQMMNYECLLYGIKGLIFGIPVSIGVTWLIYRSILRGWETGFFIPWYSVAIAVGSVFAVVFATMLYSMGKIKKDNPIDALKNENL